MSKIEHRDGVWYRDGKRWRPGFAATPQIARTEIRRHEARLESTRELLDAWREVQRIQAKEKAQAEEEKQRKADAGIERLVQVIKREYDPVLYPLTHDKALRAVRDEVLRMVAQGELEVPKDV